MWEGPGQLSRSGFHLTCPLISTAEGRDTHDRQLPKKGCQWHCSEMKMVTRLPKKIWEVCKGQSGESPWKKAPRGSLLCTAVLPLFMKEAMKEGWIWIFLCLPFGVFILPVLDINLCLIDQKVTDPQYVNMNPISSLQVTHWFSVHCLLELCSSLFFEENIKDRGAGGVLVTAINFTVHWKPH